MRPMTAVKGAIVVVDAAGTCHPSESGWLQAWVVPLDGTTGRRIRRYPVNAGQWSAHVRVGSAIEVEAASLGGRGTVLPECARVEVRTTDSPVVEWVVRWTAAEPVAWNLLPLASVAFLAAALVLIPLGLLALVSVPYFAMFPDRHMHPYDFEPTPLQRARLAQWRGAYRRLGWCGRVRRMVTRLRRRTWPRRRNVSGL